MKLLVPTDFSKQARAALRFALQTALNNKAELVFFHSTYSVVPFEANSFDYYSFIEKEKQKAMQKLQKEVQPFFNEMPVSLRRKAVFAVEFGEHPKNEILKAAAVFKPDLIVMGTHGSSGVEKMIVGSNTAALVASCPVPVLAVPSSYKSSTLTDLLYCTDLLNCEREWKGVEAISRHFKSKVSALYLDNGIAMTTSELRGEAFLKRKKVPLYIQKVSLESDFNAELGAFLSKQKHVLPVMFHETKQGIKKWLLGSHSEEIASKLPCPVIFLQK